MTTHLAGTFNCPECGKDFINALNPSKKWKIGEMVGCYCFHCHKSVFTNLLHIDDCVKEKVIFT